MTVEDKDFDEDQLFYDIVGGHDKKRRLYGFGSFAQVIPSKRDAAIGPSPGTNPEVEELMELVKKQNDQIEELKSMMKANEERHTVAIAKLQNNYAASMQLVRAYQQINSQEESEIQIDDTME